MCAFSGCSAHLEGSISDELLASLVVIGHDQAREDGANVLDL